VKSVKNQCKWPKLGFKLLKDGKNISERINSVISRKKASFPFLGRLKFGEIFGEFFFFFSFQD
jgi:hypothetical protein